MNAQRRKLFLFIGLGLLIVGVALLGYVYWPLPHNQAIERAPATLFVSPP